MAIQTTQETQTPNEDTAYPPCPLCRQLDVRLIRKGVRDDPDYPVYRCRQCDLQFISPPYDDIREYYRTEYRKEHDYDPDQALTPEQRFLTMRPLQDDSVKRFKEFVPEGASVLDIGCSSGFFLDALGPEYDRFGCEWNPEDAAYVRDVGELPCEEGGLLDIYPGQKFTAICANQVIEHQTNPAQFLRDCKERLIGGGYLYLETPSSRDALLTIYGIEEYRDRWYRKPHITYWNRETLAAALGALAFEAKVMGTQRYGLLNHMNWLLGNGPMRDTQAAQMFLQPVSEQHPMAGIMNRGISRLDKEYRILLESQGCNDTLIAKARRREI
jgi:SAM-dependent methyltransferase